MRRTLLVLLSLFAVVSACGGSTPPSTPAALTGAQIVARAAAAMAGVTSLHFVLDHQSGGTPIVGGVTMTRAEGDIARPDRLKARLSGTISGVVLRLDAVVIGSTAYVTNPLSGQWQRYDSAVSPLAFFDPAEGVSAILRGLQRVEALGESVHDGAAVYRVRGSIDSSELKSLAGSVVTGEAVEAEALIAKDGFRLLRVTLKGRLTAAEAAGLVRTLTLSDFDQPVTIEPPQ